jgi:RNA polymerase sigma factor (sigma-70 family)
MVQTETIRVGLVEDDDVIRESLAVLINGASGFECVSVNPSAENALKELPLAKPQVVLMDINLPGKSGVECVTELKNTFPEIQIIMLTMYDDDQAVFESLEAGASGYLLKRTPHVEILEAITDVWNGGSPMSSSIARKVIQSLQGKNKAREKVSQSPAPSISPREEEILKLLTKGFRYKEIADQLSISIETVRTHLRRIYEKLQVSSRTEAVVKFLGQTKD